MSLSTPTTKEISDNIIAQLESTLNQTIPLLPKSFLRLLSKVLAGVFSLLYKYGGFIFLQIFVSTASILETTINGKLVSPLKEWGRLIGVGDPVPATQAELNIDITVTNQVGSLAAGTQLINADNGVTYLTKAIVLLDAATVPAVIIASSDEAGGGGAGAIGNLQPADIVTFANPLANIDTNAVVDSQAVTGANAEATEVYRQRVVDRFQKRPQGGAYVDYELWGEEVAGIVNIYPYTSSDPGEVDVYAEATVESSGNPDGIPTAPQLQAVLDSIILDDNGLASRRPANALVNVFPITRTGFDAVVSGLTVSAGLEASTEADITTAIEQFFLDRAPFVDGLTIPPRKDRIDRSALIGLVYDIVSAVNGSFATVTFDIDTAIPSGSLDTYILQEGEKAKNTGVTYI